MNSLKDISIIATTMVLCISFALYSFSGNQEAGVFVNGVNINAQENLTLIEVGAFNGVWYIEHLQDGKLRDRLKQEIKDDAGSIIPFESRLQILNFMESNGWRYVERAPSDFTGGEAWLFRRK